MFMKANDLQMNGVSKACDTDTLTAGLPLSLLCVQHDDLYSQLKSYKWKQT